MVAVVVGGASVGAMVGGASVGAIGASVGASVVIGGSVVGASVGANVPSICSMVRGMFNNWNTKNVMTKAIKRAVVFLMM